MTCPDFRPLIERWRADPDSTYQTWFLWEERLKNFRSIRRGLQQVVGEMQAGSFGSLYTHFPSFTFAPLSKSSSLETVVKSIAEMERSG